MCWPTLRALEQVARNLFWAMLAWISGCPSSSGSQLSLAWIGPTVCDRTLCDRYVIGPYCGDSFGQMGRRGDNTTLRHGTQDRTNFALLLALSRRNSCTAGSDASGAPSAAGAKP